MDSNGVNIFLAPCTSEHFDSTLGSLVSIGDHPDRPEALSDLDDTRLWGLEPTDNYRTYFEKMQQGDIVLFYTDGRYVAVGEVERTFEDTDEWASSTFWEDAPMSLVFTITNFEAISIPKAAINEIFAYSAGYTPHGLTRVADDRVAHQPEAIRRAITKYNQAHPA